MSKCEQLEGPYKSDTIGLWWHPELQMWTSAAIALGKLKEKKGYIRITMKKNAYKNGNDKAPGYVFWINDAKSTNPKYIDQNTEEDDDENYTDRDGNRLYTEEEVRRVIAGVTYDVQRGYTDNLISDYV